MNEFIAKCGNRISGTLAGFDRLVFRGNLALNYESGMKGYLWANHVPWKDYAAHVAQISAQVKQAALAPLEASQRPIRYLSSGKDSKEQLARAIARQDGITQGSICAFTAVEPCMTWRVCGDHSSQKLRLQRCLRQCLFVYHYWMDEVFGFMSTRLQTWFPFALYVYTNGRERLACQMEQAGLRYHRQDNCFPWIEDFARAQALMDDQLRTDWAGALDACRQRAHPLFPQICAQYPMSYYWTCFQSEWAMDIFSATPSSYVIFIRS